jgi:hypothetical protein
MKSVRQVEAAEHMVAGMTFTTLFAKSLLAVTKPEFLAEPARKPKVEATSYAAQQMLDRETETLIRDLKAIEDSYGTDVLTLTICCGYVKRMLRNPRIDKYLTNHHSDLLQALRTVIADPI